MTKPWQRFLAVWLMCVSWTAWAQQSSVTYRTGENTLTPTNIVWANLTNDDGSVTLTRLAKGRLVIRAPGLLDWTSIGTNVLTEALKSNAWYAIWHDYTNSQVVSGLPTNGVAWLNVTNFGARGNGVADDTAAIQAAFTAASPSNTVYFPPGYYKISSAITYAWSTTVYDGQMPGIWADDGATVRQMTAGASGFDFRNCQAVRKNFRFPAILQLGTGGVWPWQNDGTLGDFGVAFGGFSGCDLAPPEIAGFTFGFMSVTYDTNTVGYSEIRDFKIANCKTNMVIASTSIDGWANRITIRNGSFQHSASAGTNVPGVVHLALLSTSTTNVMNDISVVDCAFEGKAASNNVWAETQYSNFKGYWDQWSESVTNSPKFVFNRTNAHGNYVSGLKAEKLYFYANNAWPASDYPASWKDDIRVYNYVLTKYSPQWQRVEDHNNNIESTVPYGNTIANRAIVRARRYRFESPGANDEGAGGSQSTILDAPTNKWLFISDLRGTSAVVRVVFGLVNGSITSVNTNRAMISSGVNANGIPFLRITARDEVSRADWDIPYTLTVGTLLPTNTPTLWQSNAWLTVWQGFTNTLTEKLDSNAWWTAWGSLSSNALTGKLDSNTYWAAWGSLGTNAVTGKLDSNVWWTSWGALGTNGLTAKLDSNAWWTAWSGSWGGLGTNALTGKLDTNAFRSQLDATNAALGTAIADAHGSATNFTLTASNNLNAQVTGTNTALLTHDDAVLQSATNYADALFPAEFICVSGAPIPNTRAWTRMLDDEFLGDAGSGRLGREAWAATAAGSGTHYQPAQTDALGVVANYTGAAGDADYVNIAGSQLLLTNATFLMATRFKIGLADGGGDTNIFRIGLLNTVGLTEPTVGAYWRSTNNALDFITALSAGNRQVSTTSNFTAGTYGWAVAVLDGTGTNFYAYLGGQKTNLTCVVTNNTFIPGSGTTFLRPAITSVRTAGTTTKMTNYVDNFILLVNRALALQ